MELHQAVAGNIHRIRKSQRLSMDRAAELAGISVSMWGQVERGSVNPTLAVLGKIASDSTSLWSCSLKTVRRLPPLCTGR